MAKWTRDSQVFNAEFPACCFSDPARPAHPPRQILCHSFVGGIPLCVRYAWKRLKRRVLFLPKIPNVMQEESQPCRPSVRSVAPRRCLEALEGMCCILRYTGGVWAAASSGEGLQPARPCVDSKPFADKFGGVACEYHKSP
jgi:hypothetical protein